MKLKINPNLNIVRSGPGQPTGNNSCSGNSSSGGGGSGGGGSGDKCGHIAQDGSRESDSNASAHLLGASGGSSASIISGKHSRFSNTAATSQQWSPENEAASSAVDGEVSDRQPLSDSFTSSHSPSSSTPPPPIRSPFPSSGLEGSRRESGAQSWWSLFLQNPLKPRAPGLPDWEDRFNEDRSPAINTDRRSPAISAPSPRAGLYGMALHPSPGGPGDFSDEDEEKELESALWHKGRHSPGNAPSASAAAVAAAALSSKVSISTSTRMQHAVGSAIRKSAAAAAAAQSGSDGSVALTAPIGDATRAVYLHQQLAPMLQFALLLLLPLVLVLLLPLFGAPSAAVAIGVAAWALIAAVNACLAFMPRVVLRQFLLWRWQQGGDGLQSALTSPDPYSPRVVVVRGKVSALGTREQLGDQGGAVISETVLRFFRLKRSARLYTSNDLLRQTHASDFVVTDRRTGVRVVVRAREACDRGLLTTLLQHSAAVPMAASHRVTGFLDAEWLEMEQHLLLQRPDLPQSDLVVFRGIVVEGQELAVLGVLRESHSVPGQIVLEPLREPHNVAKLLPVLGCIPFFFPTWVVGMAVTDNPFSIS